MAVYFEDKKVDKFLDNLIKKYTLVEMKWFDNDLQKEKAGDKLFEYMETYTSHDDEKEYLLLEISGELANIVMGVDVRKLEKIGVHNVILNEHAVDIMQDVANFIKKYYK